VVKQLEVEIQTIAVRRIAWRRIWARKIRISTALNYGVLSIGAFLMMFPFIWMMLSAFKLPQEIIAYPPVWIPSHPTLDSFIRVWTQVNFDRFFLNSLFVASVVTVTVLYTSALVGYVLAKYEFPGRDLIFLAVLSTMMVPWPVLLIPSYVMTVRFHIINSYWALIIPGLFSTFGIFLMRQYMHSIPIELIDAARIDGASEFYIFHRIVFPLCLPVAAALGIFTFMWNWDSFLWPLIVISREDLYTLPLGLAMFVGQWFTDYAGVMAGTAITVIPVVIVFLLLQRYIVEGITMTGLKA